MRLSHIALCLALLPATAFALPNSSMRGAFVVSGEQAFFPAASRADALELWITNGTPEGTHPVADLGGGTVTAMVAMDEGVVLFVSNGGRLMLWRADRTQAIRVADLGPAAVGIAVERDGQLLFSLAIEETLQVRHELWRSDGTTLGTALVRDLPHRALKAVFAGNLLYFALEPSEPGNQGTLWRTDGTPTGTFSLNRPTLPVLGRIGTSVLFGSADELWRNTDGTPQSSEFLAAIATTEIVPSGAVAYIAAYREQLWRTDGTRSGTTLLVSGRYAGWNDRIQGVIVAGDNLYYTRGTTYAFYEMKSGRSTYVGRATPTAAAAGGRFFLGDSGDYGGFYMHDGSPTPAVRVAGAVEPSSRAVTLGQRVLFWSHDDLHGFEPWITDGTTQGTRRLANIRPETALGGSVRDAVTGAPVPSAFVTVSGPGSCVTCADVSRYVNTDRDGRFVTEGLPDGRYSVRITGTGGLDYSVDTPTRLVTAAGGDIRDIDFLLQRGGAISGRVVDERGAPVAHLLLRFISATGQASAYTDMDGWYATTSTLQPETEWAVQTGDTPFDYNGRSPLYSSVLYHGVPCWTSCDPRRDGTRVVPTASQTLTGIDFVVKPAGRASGRVLDSVTGEPILTGWQLEVRGTSPSFPATIRPAGQTGEYVTPVRDGGIQITAWFDRAPYQKTVLAPIFVEPGTTSLGHDILATPTGARLRGLVTDTRTGQPIAGTAVSVLDAAGKEILAVLTTSEGEYRTPPSLLPGTYAVTSPAHGLWATQTVAVSVSGVEVANVDLPLHRLAVVSGTVRDAVTRQPVAGALVQFVAGDGFVVSRSSDAGGRFSMPVSAGSYLGRAVKGGWYVDTVHVTVTGTLDEVTETDFALAPACAPSITSPQTVFPAEGGTGRIALRSGCATCTFSSSPFLHPPPLCARAGTVTFTVDPNPGTERTGWILVPGGAITVRQEGRRARSVGR
jgi:ELWxxDGT repeat protein